MVKTDISKTALLLAPSLEKSKTDISKTVLLLVLGQKIIYLFFYYQIFFFLFRHIHFGILEFTAKFASFLGNVGKKTSQNCFGKKY